MISMGLYLLAMVLFGVAAFTNPPDYWHNRLVCFGLVAFTAAEMATRLRP